MEADLIVIRNKLGFTYLSYKALYSYKSLKTFLLFRVLDPFLHYLFFAVIASFFVGSEYLQFIVIGNIAFYTTQVMLLNFIMMFRSERHYGTLELNVAAPMSTLFIVMRKSLVPLMDSLFVFISGLIIGKFFFGLSFDLSQMMNLVLILAVTMFSILSFCLLIGAFSLVFANVNLFLNLLLAALQIFCGVNFAITFLPDVLQYISQALPLTHSIEALRIVYELGQGSIYLLLLNEFIVGLVYLFLSIVLINVMEKIARKNGSLFKDF